MDQETPIADTAQEKVFVLRNHPSVILSNLIKTAAIIAFIVIINISNITDKGEIQIRWWYLIFGVAFFAFMTFIFWRRWYLTTYTFDDTEIYVKRDTIFKSDTASLTGLTRCCA